ncbi:hypothetical protein ASO20_02465 [Mycoplasma sp. (ex Biomphalaria glabrata)]|uniref:RluA family pseudouridine synthase n=1 Tax=Mycoplasma sp. (ex Biomphalaria glabrata) TaxID=1749074 RepID=UPI00073A75A4|nr:RluA family pseudouridine synthase [Mycoplasma sp. (ex Biomphalaria glabrata)]ALV23498.1 hypothetical protein ASO20_02465 [Mycoplasma sp. (ex Biomphalaria glabrata)]
MNNNVKELFYNNNNAQRIDKFLAEELKVSRSYVQKMIEKQLVLVNDEIIKSNYVLENNDVIKIDELFFIKDESLKYVRPNVEMKLDIIYEDDYLVIINKPNDTVVHIAPGHTEDTIVNALKHHYADKLANNESIRPGIVHRIDKDTTGIIVVAKNDEILTKLQEQFQSHTIVRKYHAIVHGRIEKDKLLIDLPIKRDQKNYKKMVIAQDGKKAKTILNVLERYKNYTYVELELMTGRTHQIRVHLNYLKYPIVGDNIYGLYSDRNYEYGQYLNAFYLEFTHPITNERLKFTIDDPIEFKDKLIRISNE